MFESENRPHGYVLSTTDLMVGILFIVLIIVVYLAFINTRNAAQLREKAEQAKTLEEAEAKKQTLAAQILNLKKKLKNSEDARKLAEEKVAAAEEAARKAEGKASSAEAAKKKAEEAARKAEGKASSAEAAKKKAEEETEALIKAHVEVSKARERLLLELSNKMRERGIPVNVVKGRGIIRLPAGNLFDTGEYALSKGGEINVGKMVQVMKAVLPCYVASRNTKFRIQPRQCSGINHKIEAIFLEGHTDKRPVPENAARYKTNLELSARRALSAFDIISKDDVLKNFINSNNEYLFGVSGYGEKRPTCTSEDKDCYSANRRIDLRFMMQAPALRALIDVGIRNKQNMR